ncbi:hypothetical protein GCM10023238_06120 [Streptomyces heliomycini]
MRETGAVAVVDPREEDEAAARRLADAIERAESLDHQRVQRSGCSASTRRATSRRCTPIVLTRPADTVGDDLASDTAY